MKLLLLSIPLMPWLSGLACMLLRGPARAVAGALVVAASGWSLVALLLLHGQQMTLHGVWFDGGVYALTVGLALNGLTWFAALLVSAVALAVAVYSIGYMAGEAHRSRFFAELGVFIGAMLTLVLADSLVLLYAAWEMVGLASYLLIGFHFQQGRARAAAARAFLMTRIGDVAFLIGWLLVFLRLGTTDIEALLQASGSASMTSSFATLLALLFFSAAIGKSAQLPLSMWLPDAMAAPTPVSALLHSATMVAAGVFLLLRLYPLFATAPAALEVVLWVGFATATAAALLATAQMDLKRILAWSTISQLGEMMIAIALQAPMAAALHLVAHACFKATLFMGAGNIDHYAGTRDLREVGGLWRALPLTAACFTVAALAVAGVQPFFLESSHDAIFKAALNAGVAPAAGVLLLVFLAGVYIGRAGVAVLAGPLKSPQACPDKVRKSMRVGMLALAIATALITPIIMALPDVLPFDALPESRWSGRVMALLAGGLGLAMGGGGAWRRGPAPALGGFPKVLENIFEKLIAWPLALALGTARGITYLEGRLDAMAQALAAAALHVARGSDERAGGGLLASERMFDASGQHLAAFALHAAGTTEDAESTGFGGGGDRFAGWLQAVGAQLRTLQTGKLYLYTLGLFIWTLAVMVLAGFAFFQ